MKIELELSQVIFDNLCKEANRVGISVDELIRYELGNRFSGSYLAPIPPLSMPTFFGTASSSDTPAFISDIMRCAKQMYKELQAETGILTCKNCTQRLSTEDVQKGACSKCEAPV